MEPNASDTCRVVRQAEDTVSNETPRCRMKSKGWTWILCIAHAILLLALAGIWWFYGYDAVTKHHILAISLAGLAIGLPLLLWGTPVASK